jgi:hypothetical protein
MERPPFLRNRKKLIISRENEITVPEEQMDGYGSRLR